MIAPEQKARSTYDYILTLTDDPDVIKPIKFLREREVVHFQRFGEALEYVTNYLAENRVFVMPPMPRENAEGANSCGNTCRRN